MLIANVWIILVGTTAVTISYSTVMRSRSGCCGKNHIVLRGCDGYGILGRRGIFRRHVSRAACNFLSTAIIYLCD